MYTLFVNGYEAAIFENQLEAEDAFDAMVATDDFQCVELMIYKDLILWWEAA